MSLTLVQIQIILDTDLHVGQDDSTDYMDSMILCPLNKKEKKSKSDMIGEVPAALGPLECRRRSTVCDFPIYKTVYKELRSMDSSSMYGCNESITALLPNSMPQLQAGARATFPSATVTILL